MQFIARPPADVSRLRTDCLVLPIAENAPRLTGTVAAVDRLSGQLVRRLLDSGDFSGKSGQSALLYLPGPAGIQRLLLIGSGPAADQKAHARTAFRSWSAELGRALKELQARDVTVIGEGLAALSTEPVWAARQLASRIVHAQYRFDATLSKKAGKRPLAKVTLTLDRQTAAVTRALKAGQAIAEGTALARELGNLPGNVCTPAYLAAEARRLARRHPTLHCQVLDEKRMRELGMGALLSVSRGSAEPARLIVLQHRGGKATQAPVALVGKGITFDSGGISLKPGAKMDEMKYDMCGAASVLGTLHAAASLNLPLNLVGVIAAAENLPSGTATKPGDVVTSMAGKTIEVLNTDAEGRLVLCDALSYVGRFKPETVIDIATLTGACVVALGEHASGLFSNDDRLAEELLEAGTTSGDRAWRLPLWDDYRKQLKSPFADLANIGGPSAGSITAACFLSHFTEAYRWAHLDIAGSAWQSNPKGATGRPVGLLCQFLLQRAGIA